MYEELIKRLRNRRICIQQSGSLDDFPLLKEAADAIEELICEVADEHNARLDAEERQRWIPVSERLPDEDGKYLCTVRSFSHYNNRQYCFVDVLVFQNSCFFECGIGMDRVTHWMPLPEPPEEE